MTAGFALNPEIAVRREIIGNEREPVLAIDGLLRDPAALVEFADAADFAPAHGPAGGYPGLRAPAPLDYVGNVVRSLTPLIARAFGLGPVEPTRAECFLSLVTLPPGDLHPTQRLPHIDTVDPLQFALLHYLCGPPHGGTAFYRHEATGFERITADRRAAFEAAVAREAAESPAAGYLTGNRDGYVQTGRIDAAFDRLVIYRSQLLHSGQITAPEALSADPRRGRLTANIFVAFRRG
ncbi:hypothetical protein D1610_08930 [Sphingomonas gilva]|uniref:Uncharacterized protein n=1 Tax=Sphingomonas gilva TaxID=2305907 RepID=A0A396RMF1_9SPHN|nr:DUF6445 family protein [Sphingomonas gilva]RHW17570.1 hypothetical protein D1610_08930 [Sphingomonas gilva]